MDRKIHTELGCDFAQFDALHMNIDHEFEPDLATTGAKFRGGIFDLYGADTELQDASAYVGDPLLELDGTLVLAGQDTLSPLPDVPYSESHSSLNHVLSSSSTRCQSSTDSISSRAGGRSRLPRSATSLLDTWLENNMLEPYLRAQDAEAFAHITGITAQQVKTYIANARARKIAAPAQQRQLSALSLSSIGSNVSLVPRRGRRMFRAASLSSRRSSASLSQQTLVAHRKYRCTFPPCLQSFAGKYDWKRHEETIHVPQKVWICMPAGQFDVFDDASCSFCGWNTTTECETTCQENRDCLEQHLCDKHDYRHCLAKNEIDRTFFRKDKLMQHLRQVHDQKTPLTGPQSRWWRPTNEDERYQCGFCSSDNLSWPERVEHVAEHFEYGRVETLLDLAFTHDEETTREDVTAAMDTE